MIFSCPPEWLPWVSGVLVGVGIGLVLGVGVAHIQIQRTNQHSQFPHEEAE